MYIYIIGWNLRTIGYHALRIKIKRKRNLSANEKNNHKSQFFVSKITWKKNK